jgi:hypothetical protein
LRGYAFRPVPQKEKSDVVIAFQLLAMLAALALGFVLGRIWEMRREIRREFSAHMSDSTGFARLSEPLGPLGLSLRSRSSGMEKSDEARVDHAMTTAEREAREIAALMARGANVMEAIRTIKERKAA